MATVQSSVDRLRKNIGDPFICGTGVEVGAGLCPVFHKSVDKLFFCDKRDEAAFELLFGAKPGYEILSPANVLTQFPAGLDFVTSHHVLEHAHDPIRLVSQWVSFLRPEGGVLYLSIPSHNHACEARRLATPIRHILEDYFFDRAAGSYESKSHIPSFILMWTALSDELRPWYAKKSIDEYARIALDDISARDDHDLHWHTYTMDVARILVEVAFYISGAGCERLVAEESDDSIYLAYRRCSQPKMPDALAQFKEEIAAAAERLARL